MKKASGIVMIFGTLFLIAAVIFVSGCSTIGAGQDLAKQGIDTTVALNDAKLGGSETLYCDGQSTGAVARKYGSNKELWTEYWKLCNMIRGAGAEVPIPPYPGGSDAD